MGGEQAGRAQDERRDEREALVADIAARADEFAPWIGDAGYSPAVLAALRRVPRHRFVPEEKEARAYDDCALPIGHGQTISQPTIVALMTELARVRADSRVLEIGTGCGYQAAVLAEIAREVWTIEVVPELADAARARLAGLGYRNVQVRCGDGALGWVEQAPFDAIVVTAAPRRVPPALVEQLAPGARLVIPVGSSPFDQELRVVEKDSAGRLHERGGVGVAFVPLVSRSVDEPESG
jgi:protein-L-isoaspartate(D-aspartate) O-methyltransferase